MKRHILWPCLAAILVPLKSVAIELDRLDINGYFSFEYEKIVGGDKYIDGDPDEPTGDVDGSFDADLFDLVLNFRATDNLRLAADLTWEHGTATEDDRGNAAVEYAFAEYTIKNWAKVRAGKMFVHFGIYNEIHTAKPASLTIKEPLSTNKNNKLGSGFRFYPRWGNGLALTGNHYMGDMDYDYIVQVLNGDSDNDDANPYEEDDNVNKAVNMRFRINLLEDLRIGASAYRDKLQLENSSADLSTYGIQAEWTAKPVGVEFEYIFGDVNYSDSAEPDVSRYAYSLMAYAPITDRITPYVRYEFLDPNDDVDNDEGVVSVLGVNLLVDKNMYVKFELYDVNTEENNSEFLGADFTEFKASLSIGF